MSVEDAWEEFRPMTIHSSPTLPTTGDEYVIDAKQIAGFRVDCERNLKLREHPDERIIVLLCDSHERLRAELDAAKAIADDHEKQLVRIADAFGGDARDAPESDPTIVGFVITRLAAANRERDKFEYSYGQAIDRAREAEEELVRVRKQLQVALARGPEKQ